MFTNDNEVAIQEVVLKDNPNSVKLFIKREDMLHPIISGNKWRKLKYNLVGAREQNESTLLTFGGAYSNHIHAVAGAANEYGFKSIGIIRGEEHLPLNPTLEEAKEMGMTLHYLDRTTYREKDSKEVIESLQQKFGQFYLIPEGGTNELAIKGAAEIVNGIEDDYDYFCLACGTAGTATGIITGLQDRATTIGFSVLKGDFHRPDIESWLARLRLSGLRKWKIETSYHFGGYAKHTSDLVDFINNFNENYGIPLDPIYTGKLFYGIINMISRGKFHKNARVLAIHTGGLQGIKGFNERFGNLIKHYGKRTN